MRSMMDFEVANDEGYSRFTLFVKSEIMYSLGIEMKFIEWLGILCNHYGDTFKLIGDVKQYLEQCQHFHSLINFDDTRQLRYTLFHSVENLDFTYSTTDW